MERLGLIWTLKLNNALSFNEYVEADGNSPTCEQETEELCKEVTDNKEKAEAVYKPTPTFTNCSWKDTLSAVWYSRGHEISAANHPWCFLKHNRNGTQYVHCVLKYIL